jgi:hypothetical protein
MQGESGIVMPAPQQRHSYYDETYTGVVNRAQGLAKEKMGSNDDPNVRQ